MKPHVFVSSTAESVIEWLWDQEAEAGQGNPDAVSFPDALGIQGAVAHLGNIIGTHPAERNMETDWRRWVP